MTKVKKALLMSAFVFPGTGHILLKRYISSIVLTGIALFATVAIMRFVINQAILISNKVLQGEVEPNIFIIRSLIAEQQARQDSLLFNLSVVDVAGYLLITVWLISILDCYRIMKTSKNAEQLEN